MASIYYDILKNTFPKGYCLAFAYGSSVFKQIGHISSKYTMMDFIIAVEDPLEWHQSNLIKNSSHYSFLKYVGGPQHLAKVQDDFGAKVYFNTLIPTYAGLIKYGVVSKANLISDLLDWDTLYLSGRLHKPVDILHIDDDDKLKMALKVNLCGAIHTALLLLPEYFTEKELYSILAGLSYSGDFRMLIGEDRNKVKNIVSSQMAAFRELYSPILRELKDYVFVDYKRGSGEQDVSIVSKFFHLSMLPKMLQHELMKEWNRDCRNRDLEDVLRSAAVDPDVHDSVAKGVSRIVQISSLSQSLKGLLTAGPLKSLLYSVLKLRKMWKSFRR